MSRERSSDEANPQKEGEYDNPISDTFEDEAAESPSKASMDQKTADLDHDLTDDELSDLTFAFQAMDGDNSGTIELPELLAMMSVLGAEVSDADVKELFQSCKVEFMTWMNSHDQDAALPEYMKHTTGEAGQHGETKHGGVRHNVDLAIDRSNKQHPVFSRMKKVGRNPVLAYTVGAPITATNKLLSVSYNLAKDTTAQVATGLLGGSEEGARPQSTIAPSRLRRCLIHPHPHPRTLTRRLWLAQRSRRRRLLFVSCSSPTRT